MSTPKILKINPELFKFNNGKKSSKKKDKKTKPVVDKNITLKTNKLKKELLKKVKDYQKKKDTETQSDEKATANNLFTNGEFENSDFEREFNKSLTFLHELSKKKKEKRNKSVKALSHIDVNIEIPKDSLIYNNTNNTNNNIVKQPTYSCLKNGSKPTLKELNKTQKNNNHSGGKRLIIDLNNNKYYESKPPILDDNRNIESEVQVHPQEVQVHPQEAQVHPQEVQVYPQEVQVHPQEAQVHPQEVQIVPNVYSYDNKAIALSDKNLHTNNVTPSDTIITPQEEPNIDLNIPKINRITRTYKYTLGKKNGAKHIGLLIKNRDTQKRIKEEVNNLKQQPIQEIKNYLRTKNLIKLGSQAPNDVLRKLYEDSILAGEITNNNANNLVYNFMN